jgi:hypothetical protein
MYACSYHTHGQSTNISYIFTKKKVCKYLITTYACLNPPTLLDHAIMEYNTPFDGDQGTTSNDLIQVPIGPITRARAKKFKDVLNGLIQELWAQINSLRPIEHDPQWQQRIVTLIQVLEG